MKISLNWLREFVDIPVNKKKPTLKNVVVGYVENIEKHPNADKLNVATVDVGNKKLQIVCGGVNLKANTYVPVALPGAILPGNFEIKISKIRGIESFGMICHLSELGLAKKDESHEISIIKKDKPGTPFIDTLDLKGYSPEELGYLFTTKVAEVEKIEKEWEKLENVVTGKLISIKKIASSKLHYEGLVDIGSKKITLVFGSVHKLEEGWILPIALPGARLPIGEIKEVEMHGVKSHGMVAEDKELGIENSKTGLTIFPKNTPLGKPIAEVLGFDDVIFEIENKSLTHRPDLWGHYGIAREFATILGAKLKPYKTDVKFPKKGRQMKVTVKAPKLCPRYSVVIIENLKVEESPEWLKRKLIAVGRGAHNNFVDVTNYITEELGQPMHAFDLNNIHEEIIVRNAEEGEKLTTLDGKERILSKDMLVIADKTHALGSPVMGGMDSGTTEKTTSIMLEAANFDPVSTRKTAIKWNARTDSAQKIEKSLDPHLVEMAMNKACEIILQICPKARIAGPITDIKNFNEKPVEVEMSVSKTCSKIGAEISAKEMIKILEQLEFKAKMKGKDIIKVTVPSFRATKDVSIAEDLVEEVARIYGYSKIEPILPNIPSKLPIENTERRLEYRARDILSFGLGFTEVQTYSFYGKREIANAKLPQELHIELENHLSEDQTHLRTSLLPNMLKAVEQNIKSFNGFKIYEIGHTFIEHKSFFPIEENYICGIIVENKKTAKNKELFYEVKGAFETFLSAFGSVKLNSEKNTSHHSYTNSSKCISYKTTDENAIEIATVYELNPIVLKNFGLEDVKIACFKINFTRLTQLNTQKKTYTPIPKFPEIKIDISIIFPKSKTVEEVEEIIKSSGAKYITDVELFDVFIDKSIGENMRALAFKITLRSDEKTLTLEEMAEDQKKIFEAMKSNGGIIRGT
ncbi:MAG: phenylalanine--tRNA ligase subunit beta [Candidatus Gracilibacteria bacterium]